MHYVVINEWSVDNGEMANGVEIIAVCHSEEEAREAFEKKTSRGTRLCTR